MRHKRLNHRRKCERNSFQKFIVWLFDLECSCHNHRRTKFVKLRLHPIDDDFIVINTGECCFMAQLLNTQRVLATARPLDADGNPTAATIAFTSSDTSVVSVTDNGDGTAMLDSGADGSATVTATATDADGAQVSASVDIDVVPPTIPPAATASVDLTLGTPEDKPVG